MAKKTKKTKKTKKAATVAPRDLRIDYGPAEADRRADYAGRVMTRNGLPVDHGVAWKIYTELTATVERLTEEIRDTLPKFTLRPAGVWQAVYGDLALQPDLELPTAVTMTATGAPSTDHRALCGIVRRLPQDSDASRVVRRIILAKKALTTSNNAKGFLSPARLARLETAGVAVPDVSHVVDGYIHARYAPRTLNGRYAASKPNVHALNSTLKAIFRRDGWSFVQADMDQIHIRIQANEWRIQRLLDVLTSGEDPHMNAMRSLLGEDVVARLQGFVDWFQKPAYGTPSHYSRQTGKVTNYTGSYGGGAATLLAAALKDIDDTGYPTMPHASLAMFQDVLKRRKEREPDWARHYAQVRAEWKSNGYLQTSGTHRRFRCKTGKVTELYNCTVLGFEADLMGQLTADAARLWPTYLRNQSHDSLVLLAPDAECPALAEQLTQLMTVRYVAQPGEVTHPIPYTSGASITPTLQEH